jgi:hypothetical protein
MCKADERKNGTVRRKNRVQENVEVKKNSIQENVQRIESVREGKLQILSSFGQKKASYKRLKISN